MKAAIYSRKSKLTAKGESVENQIQLCKEYGRNLGVTEYFVYEDEGFSGKDTERPEFQRMLKDAKNKKFDVLICYRLDRISRNVLDFSSTVEELSKLNIAFVSIREQFDTSTPMGRAMMYIASVFAQLERETIAERIKDNMMELAKTGRWLGGPPPFGFRINRISENGKEVSYLTPVPDELETVKLLYAKYLEFGSLYKTLKYLLRNDIQGRSWSSARIGEMLKNCAYVISSKEVFQYLESESITVIGEPDDIHGLTQYNKHDGSRKNRPKDEWVFAVSNHEGIIDGSTWVKVQKSLQNNFRTRDFKLSTSATLLNGLLRCDCCESRMTEQYGVKRKDGTRPFYYRCENKNNSGKVKCNNPNAKAHMLDKNVVDTLIKICLDENTYKSEASAFSDISKIKDTERELQKIKKAVSKNELAIQNLVKQLSQLSVDASSFIIAEIEKLSKQNAELKSQQIILERTLDSVSNTNNDNNQILSLCRSFPEAYAKAETIAEQKALIFGIVKEIRWDGKTESGKIELKKAGS